MIMPNAMITANKAYSDSVSRDVTPKLSVLIPFYKESPVWLLDALENDLCTNRQDIEIIILDDGSSMRDISHAVNERLLSMSFSAKFIGLMANEGRSKGRNRLTCEARGEYYLFLDSDMLPDSPDFLTKWLEVISKQKPDVVFGGFSLIQAPQDKQFALHRLMAAQSDCLSADQRQLSPEKYIFTSNLLVRRDIFKSQRFDDAFSGWGWEDVEWAMRVAQNHAVTHIENSATHMGLDTAQTLIHKYEQSVGNFALVIKSHAHIVSRYPSYRWARLLKALPFAKTSRHLFKTSALNEALPLRVRALALRFFRASLYAQVV